MWNGMRHGMWNYANIVKVAPAMDEKEVLVVAKDCGPSIRFERKTIFSEE